MPEKLRFQKKHAIILAGFALTFAGMVAAAIVSGDGHPDGMEGLGQAAQGEGAAPPNEASGGMTMTDLNRSLAESTALYGGDSSPAPESASPLPDRPLFGWPFSGPEQSGDANDYPRVENPLTPSS